MREGGGEVKRENKTRLVNFRLSYADKRWFQSCADALELTLSEYVRQTVNGVIKPRRRP